MILFALGIVFGLLFAVLINAASIAFRKKQIVQTLRVGLCPDCKVKDGCSYDCPTLDPNSPHYNQYTNCIYEVEAKRGSLLAFYVMCKKARVPVKHVNELNYGRRPDRYWRVGSRVTIPYGLCRLVVKPAENN